MQTSSQTPEWESWIGTFVPDAPAIVQVTTSQFKGIRDKARDDFYFFATVPWGLDKAYEPLHRPLCDFLQRDAHPRKGIFGSRGCFKSSFLEAYAAWTGLHCWDLWGIDWSWLWVEQKHDNAVAHHRKFQNKFKFGPQAELLCDLYSDRIPTGFTGWTDVNTILNRKDPNSEVFLTVGSLDSKLEGIHRNGVICDDLEGADADKSDAPNEASWNFVESRAPDLLIEPATGPIIVGGTPHGPDPLAFKIREQDAVNKDGDWPDWKKDNEKRIFWHIWWAPKIDEQGLTVFPSRFPQTSVDLERARAKVSPKAKVRWDKQCMLRKRSAQGREFDMDLLRETVWRSKMAHGPNGATRLVWQYPKVREEDGVLVLGEMTAVDPAVCWFYLSWDPAHKESKDRVLKRGSDHGFTVVAITPDFHALLVEALRLDIPINRALDEFFRLYRKYRPKCWSYEAIGAQSWLENQVEMVENLKYPRPHRVMSTPTPWFPQTHRLALPSTRVKIAKFRHHSLENEIINTLSLPINMRFLHVNEKDERTMQEFELFGSSSENTFDVLSALAQQPRLWDKPPTPEALIESEKRRRFLQAEEALAGQRDSPWTSLPQTM